MQQVALAVGKTHANLSSMSVIPIPSQHVHNGSGIENVDSAWHEWHAACLPTTAFVLRFGLLSQQVDR